MTGFFCEPSWVPVLRHKLLRAVISGRRQVGFTELPASPESITSGDAVKSPAAPPRFNGGLWLWIPGGTRARTSQKAPIRVLAMLAAP
jgi:hypothetical protein